MRLVLNLKEIEYEYRAVNLTKDGGAKQYSEEHFKLNPMKRVPALIIDGHTIAESVAICEYIEETRNDKRALLPSDPFLRAKVRQLAEIVNSGIQPLQNLEVLNKLEEFGQDKMAWSQHFIRKGLTAYEEVLKETMGKYSVGDEVTLADCFLIP